MALDRQARERGATAVVVAIVLGAICAFLALVINSGHVMAVRNQLQNATDSAALAGVRQLDGTTAGVSSARTVAASYAAQHITDRGLSITIDPSTDVQVGIWNASMPRASAFTPVTVWNATTLAQANAVLVNAGREASRGNPVLIELGGLLGMSQTDVTASAVAVGGGPPTNPCGVLPLSFSSCAMWSSGGTLNCDATLTFNKDGSDNMGFTNLTSSPGVTPGDMISILSGSCPVVSIGDLVWVSNGAKLPPVVPYFKPYVNVPSLVPVVDVPGCKFVTAGQGFPVIGFMTVTITSVNGPPSNSISIKTDCTQSPVTTVGGGANFGTTATQPALVR